MMVLSKRIWMLAAPVLRASLLGSGFYIKCGFEKLEVAAGSVATISVVLASRPA